MVTFWGVLLVLGILAVARYGADSRATSDPTGRDPAWSGSPRRDHTPTEDLSRLGRLLAHHLRAWEVFDRSLRPWERDAQTTVAREVAPAPRDDQADARRTTASSRASGDRV